MPIQSTKGTEFHLEKKAATPLVPAVTGITKADPPVVTVTDATGLMDDQVITITASDFSSIDGIPWIIDGLSGTTFNLLGADTTDESGALGSPVASVLEEADLELLAPSNFDPSPGTATDESIGTFVDPEATLPGIAAAGSYALGGFMDTSDVGYQELLLAEADGVQRILRIKLAGQKFVVAPI